MRAQTEKKNPCILCEYVHVHGYWSKSTTTGGNGMRRWWPQSFGICELNMCVHTMTPGPAIWNQYNYLYVPKHMHMEASSCIVNRRKRHYTHTQSQSGNRRACRRLHQNGGHQSVRTHTHTHTRSPMPFRPKRRTDKANDERMLMPWQFS